MSATIQIEQLKTLILNVYRFDPSKDNKAYMQDIEIEIPANKVSIQGKIVGLIRSIV